MKNIIALILVLVSFLIFGLRISKAVELKQHVTGYLKRAADANSIALAYEEMTKSINYLEANHLTSGFTSIFWKTPDEDIDFWYRNLKASQEELQNLEPESILEKTNVLMKLRETLLDNGQDPKVTIPEGLSVYPNNGLWAFLLAIAVLSGFSGFIIILKDADKSQKKG